MKKELLVNGSVVELRNGLKYLYIDGTLLCVDSLGEAEDIDDYDEELISLFDAQYDIMKIHVDPKSPVGLLSKSLRDVFWNDKWMWVRGEEKEKCDNCNIIESFSETMLLVLKLLDDSKIEEAKFVMKNFLDERK